MAPRTIFVALIAAFGIAATFATVTTVRQVHLAGTPHVQHVRG
jgi:hypothetical protein